MVFDRCKPLAASGAAELAENRGGVRVAEQALQAAQRGHALPELVGQLAPGAGPDLVGVVEVQRWRHFGLKKEPVELFASDVHTGQRNYVAAVGGEFDHGDVERPAAEVGGQRESFGQILVDHRGGGLVQEYDLIESCLDCGVP